MEKKDHGASGKTIREHADCINALLKLSSNNFEPSSIEHMLSHELNISKSLDMDFAIFLIDVARSYREFKSSIKADPSKKEHDSKPKTCEELAHYIEPMCNKFGVDKNLALIGIKLRQGDFFVIEDCAAYLTPLLPTPIVRRLAMSLCGVLTHPISFKTKYGEYPERFTDALSSESACESLCSLLKINPVVARLAALDEETLKLIEAKFGFSRKAVLLLILTLTYK